MPIDDFFDYLICEKGLAIATVAAYRRDLLACEKWIKKPLETAQEEDIRAFFAFQKAQGYADSSLARAWIALGRFFQFLRREKRRIDHPMAFGKVPKAWQRIPRALSQADTRKLFQTVLESVDEEAVRDRVILELLYGCGLRASELSALSLADIHQQALRIVGKGGKERLVPLGEYASQAIDAYLVSFRDRFVDVKNLLLNGRGKPMTRVDIWRRVRFRAEQAQLSVPLSPHVLRHSFATHLLDHQANIRVIQEMLGHADISSTDRYTQVSRERLKETFMRHHPRYTSF